MLVAGPQRGLFLVCLAVGVGSLVSLDLYFAPEASRAAAPDEPDASAPVVEPVAVPPPTTSPSSTPTPSATAAPSPVRVVVPAEARVPTIIARFDSEAKEPSDQTAIRTLAGAMIEDHDVKVVLEGHSDTRGGEDFNHQISLARAEWVKERLVELGVSPERIETVGLGATHPLRSDDPDAQAVNRRVEVRWQGR